MTIDDIRKLLTSEYSAKITGALEYEELEEFLKQELEK